jgi:tetratricopeptide (TPR) repeat protein
MHGLGSRAARWEVHMTRENQQAVDPGIARSASNTTEQNFKTRPRRAGLVAAALIATTLSGAGRASAQDAVTPPQVATGTERDIDHTFSPRIGQGMPDILEQENAGEWAQAVEGYTALLDRPRLSAFERATILLQRGRALYETEHVAAAISDWRTAISINALSREQSNTLRINTGQLLMVTGEMRAGINLIESAIALGVEISPDLSMRLATAYAQIEDYPPGLIYARQTIELAEQPEERHYSLLLYFLQSLEMESEQLATTERMVDLWPQEKRYWSSWAAMLARDGQERRAFEVNTIMYVEGMLTRSDELMRLAQYYSYYDYPYRAATIVERELNAGRIEQTPANYTALAQFWRGAREWERALPVLHRVATMTGSGDDYVKLGEAHYQSANYAEAEAVFTQALSRSDLDRSGDAWNLLGAVRYEQGDYVEAIEAYERGLEHEYSRATAQGWIDFVEQAIAIRNDVLDWERRVELDRCTTHVEEVRRGMIFVSQPERQYDAESRLILPLEAECLTYFDRYGDIRPEFERV